MISRARALRFSQRRLTPCHIVLVKHFCFKLYSWGRVWRTARVSVLALLVSLCAAFARRATPSHVLFFEHLGLFKLFMWRSGESGGSCQPVASAEWIVDAQRHRLLRQYYRRCDLYGSAQVSIGGDKAFVNQRLCLWRLQCTDVPIRKLDTALSVLIGQWCDDVWGNTQASISGYRTRQPGGCKRSRHISGLWRIIKMC